MTRKENERNYIWSVFITAALVLLAATVLFGIVMHLRISAMMLYRIRSNALDIAGITAELVDAEAFARIADGDTVSADYQTVLAQLARVRDSSDVEYLYTIRMNADNEVVFVVDSDPVDPGMPGELYTGSDAAMTALQGTAAAEDEPYKDRWGTHMSAYAPLRAGGRVVGAAVVDLRYDEVLREVRMVSGLVVVLCVVFFLMSTLLLLFVARQMERTTMQLVEAKEAAEESDRAKSAFFAQISHEIRTPINAMLGMNEMILREARSATPDEETMRKIESNAMKAEGAGEELRAIMEDMLDFAKLERQGQGHRDGSFGTLRGQSHGHGDHRDGSFGTESCQKNRPCGPHGAPAARILAVDDIELNLSVIGGLLEETRIAIDGALSGEDALALTRQNHYDLILMDQRMPGLNGTETMRAIRAQEDGLNVRTPVVCVTGDVIQGARERYLAEGFDGYMAKPLNGEALRALVMGFLPEEKVEWEEIGGHGDGSFGTLRGQSQGHGDHRDGSFGTISCQKNRPCGPRAPGSAPEACQKNRPRGATPHFPAGLDYEAAKASLGTDALIMDTLRRFYESAEENVTEIERLLAAEDYENYTIRVHALKSSARMIGAAQLSEDAAYLEKCGNVATEA